MKRKKQFCPYCAIEMVHQDGYFQCPKCTEFITDEDVQNGWGYDTEDQVWDTLWTNRAAYDSEESMDSEDDVFDD